MNQTITKRAEDVKIGEIIEFNDLSTFLVDRKFRNSPNTVTFFDAAGKKKEFGIYVKLEVLSNLIPSKPWC